jgi:hypothetical protein
MVKLVYLFYYTLFKLPLETYVVLEQMQMFTLILPVQMVILAMLIYLVVEIHLKEVALISLVFMLLT